MLIFIGDITEQPHVIDEKCYFFQIIVWNIFIPANSKFFLELIFGIGGIYERYDSRYVVKKFCSLRIFEYIVFDRVNKDDMTPNLFGIIDKLIKFPLFQVNIRRIESVEIFNNYNIVFCTLEKVNDLIQMPTEYGGFLFLCF